LGRYKKTAVAIAAIVVAPLRCWALFDDHVDVWASANATHDTNVLRLSKSIDPASLGVPQRGDDILTGQVGVVGRANPGQQRFAGEATWYKSDYRKLNGLDFSGHTYKLDWQWYLDSRFNGSMGYTEAKGLSSFANIQSPVKDLVTSRYLFATGYWNVTPRYRANAKIDAGENRHSDIDRSVNDLDNQSAEVGLSYVTPLENSFGVVTRYEHGKLPHAPTAGTNEYNQAGVGLMLVWLPASHSRIDARADYVHRDYNNGSQADYNGPIARIIYTWSPTAKFALGSSIYRDVGPANDIQTSLVLITGAYVRPRWTITDKVTLQANAEYNKWDYRQDAGNFTNRVRMFGASLSWRATEKILFQAGVNREVRTSTTPTGDYEVTVAFIEGRVGF
jgi:putative beta-barrel porin BBP2